MAYEFFVVMQKRSDGKIYADLHKTDERMYLVEDEADAALVAMGELAKHFHKVKMVGVLADEWHNDKAQGEAQGSSRLSPGATSSAAGAPEKGKR